LRILFLSSWFPYPPNNGSKIRIFNLISHLAREHEVTLVSFAKKVPLESVKELENCCEGVYVLPEKVYDASSVRALLGFFSQKPRVLVDRYVSEMDKRIQDEIIHGKHDLIIASQFYMADYLSKPRKIPAIFEEVEVGVFVDAVIQTQDFLRNLRRRLTLFKLQTYFHNLLNNFDACTVVSENERKLLKDIVPDYHTVEIIPNGVNLADYRDVLEKPKPGQLIFTGSLTYYPNYYAMLWFIDHVFPKIQAEVPNVQLTITGENSERPLPDVNNINLTGYVEDIRPLISSSRVSLAPIFTGGGTRLKILEAFALQTPVVATTKGAEGLDVYHEEHLLLADTPEEFADQTIRLLKDEELRQKLITKAYQLLIKKYDWSVIMPHFLNLVERVTKSSKIKSDIPVT
jgi:glycosyltransferase involved in cell wall biosynthesis